MKLANIFIIFTFLLAFAFQVSAQDEKPKIVWKNLQEKYESFYDIKPIIANFSDQPIYFSCLSSEYGTFADYGYNLTFKLLFNNVRNHWDWNIFHCGFRTTKQLKQIEKQEKKKAKLIKQGKYFPSGCKLEPNQEVAIKISKELWDSITGKSGDPYAHYVYESGKYKFTLEYEWANIQNPLVTESPEFSVSLIKEAK